MRRGSRRPSTSRSPIATAAGARRDLDELLGRLVAAVRLVDAHVHERRTAAPAIRSEQQQRTTQRRSASSSTSLIQIVLQDDRRRRRVELLLALAPVALVRRRAGSRPRGSTAARPRWRSVNDVRVFSRLMNASDARGLRRSACRRDCDGIPTTIVARPPSSSASSSDSTRRRARPRRPSLVTVDRLQRPRQRARRIADREADPARADIDRQHPTLHPVRCYNFLLPDIW